MHVVATAGHVDHGKSTLLRALTGMEPDRWDEERRRGLTIDLGFVWTTLASGRTVAFVDVPGHERFLGNMLAGLGPAPVVLFVVAADEGWCAQSSDHRDALAALGIRYGLLVITRVDRAPERVDETIAQARTELADTCLRDAPAVAVSAPRGVGVEEVRSGLDAVLAETPALRPEGRVRVWVDRSFAVKGAGTVVTGTLPSGTVRVGDRVELWSPDARKPVTVRGIESLGEPHTEVGPVSRVALNLRGVASRDIHRGDVIVTPDAWFAASVLDVRRVSGHGFRDAPQQVTAHIGAAAVQGRLRPFGAEHARLTLRHPVPASVGDRLVLRGPGSRRVLAGAVVLDADPPRLRRRGDATRRDQALGSLGDAGDARVEVARRGAVESGHLRRLGVVADETSVPDGVRAVGGWWVDTGRLDEWATALRAEVDRVCADDPLAGGVSLGAARDLLSLRSDAVLEAVISRAGLDQADGKVRSDAVDGGLGPVEPAVQELEARLTADPFSAPEAGDLGRLGLDTRALAAAERAGRLLRLSGGVVLLPTAPALAMREIARLEQPFTTSQARKALGTTRRVAIPLLEHLDKRGWTRRLDGTLREVTGR